MSPSGTNPSADKTVETHLPDQDGGRDQGVSRATSVGKCQLQEEAQQEPKVLQEPEARQEPEAQQGPVPPDGGWGWVVAGGVFLVAVSPTYQKNHLAVTVFRN